MTNAKARVGEGSPPQTSKDQEEISGSAINNNCHAQKNTKVDPPIPFKVESSLSKSKRMNLQLTWF